MKPVLLLAAAAVVMSAAPAQADNGQVFDWAAQTAAYSNTLPRDQAKQCFNGKFLSGVNRSGANTLYVQSPKKGIYRLRLAGYCSALNDARKLTVRSNGSDLVCPGEAAQTIAWTSAGAQRCEVDEVHRLTAREAGDLSAASRR
jgi:hypothetical protein